MEANKALEEFMGPRADNSAKKSQMYQDIITKGYVQLNDLESDVEDSQAINSVDVYFTGAGIKTDLITSDLSLMRTIKDKRKRVSAHERLE